jgi:uncharacterized protein YjbI with pentapeptide repeats
MIGFVRRHALALAVSLVILFLTLGLGLLALNPPWQALQVADELARLSALDATSLATEKLRQEVLQLSIENVTKTSGWSLVLSLAPLAAALAAAAGVLVTLGRQLSEQAQQRRAEVHEREVENLRRFDDAFTRVVANLGADSPALRVSAAVSLPTFLRPEYREVHDQVLSIAVANVKKAINQPEPVQRILVRVIEQALRARMQPIADSDRGFLLDFSRTFLERANFSGLDLTRADVAFATLRNADLTDANLFRLLGREVDLGGSRLSRANLGEARLQGAKAQGAQFHDSKCVSARLENSDLSGAEFYRAEMQEAHLEEAILTGATFRGANLNNAYFAGATFDDKARRTIAKGAVHWRDAHFDPADLAALEALDEGPGAS